jgi:hypothetical protein
MRERVVHKVVSNGCTNNISLIKIIMYMFLVPIIKLMCIFESINL